MRFRFDIGGETYSKHKEAFKRVLARHGLRWHGTLDRPEWRGRAERVHASYERDEAKDVLVRATLVWEGQTKSKLLEDLKAWAWEVGGKVEEEKRPAADEVTDDVERALTLWDIVNKPDVDRLRERGRPSAWIEEDVRRWKRRRQERRRELMGQID